MSEREHHTPLFARFFETKDRPKFRFSPPSLILYSVPLSGVGGCRSWGVGGGGGCLEGRLGVVVTWGYGWWRGLGVSVCVGGICSLV